MKKEELCTALQLEYTETENSILEAKDYKNTIIEVVDGYMHYIKGETYTGSPEHAKELSDKAFKIKNEAIEALDEEIEEYERDLKGLTGNAESKTKKNIDITFQRFILGIVLSCFMCAMIFIFGIIVGKSEITATVKQEVKSELQDEFNNIEIITDGETGEKFYKIPVSK